MDKLAYHYNKKKLKGSREGTYLYYYPCDNEEQANTHLEGKGYIVIEVTEQQWKDLLELDRFEYNNYHKYARHTSRIEDDDTLDEKESSRLIDNKDDFDNINNIIAENDKKLISIKLTETEQNIIDLSGKGFTQKDIAEKLGFSQSYVSVTLRQANAKLSAIQAKNETLDEKVNRYWEMFIEKGEMPMFFDVIFFHAVHCLTNKDLFYFFEWFYSFGEFMRYLMRYCLDEDEDKEQAIADFLATATTEERDFFSSYEKMIYPLQYIYIKLYKEILRRKKEHYKRRDVFYMLGDFDEVLFKIAMRLKISPDEVIRERFLPYFVEFRNNRIRAFYKHFRGKDLPE